MIEKKEPQKNASPKRGPLTKSKRDHRLELGKMLAGNRHTIRSHRFSRMHLKKRERERKHKGKRDSIK